MMRPTVPTWIVLAIATWSLVLGLAQAQQASAPEAAAQKDGGNLKKAPDFSSNEIYLLESALKSFRVVQRIDLPNRVYMKKTTISKDHQYFFTGPDGKLDSPQRFLLVGSVVRGDRIGGSRDRYFVLTKEAAWRNSKGAEIYYVKEDTARGSTDALYPPAPDK
ncbi:MAG: hypothetical protein ACKVP0_11470 [Pirellulaceae bacterium]